MHFSILSDLKKTTAVVESLSTTSTRCSVTEITSLLQDSTNRMRNLYKRIILIFDTDLNKDPFYSKIQLALEIKPEEHYIENA